MESKETVGDPTQSPPALTAATDAHDPALMGEAHAPALERPRNGSVGSGDHQVVRPRIVRDLLSLQGGIFVVEALQLPPSFPGGGATRYFNLMLISFITHTVHLELSTPSNGACIEP